MTDDVLTTYKIPPPDDKKFGYVIASIQKAHAIPSIFEPSVQHQIGINGALWKVSSEWLIRKKWIPRQKISANRSITKAVEPLGELLYRLLEVCIQSHSFLPADTPYRNAAQWFQAVAFEMKKHDFNEITLMPERKGSGKMQYVRSIRTDIKALKDWNNPNDSQKDPATYALVEAGLAIAEKSDSFMIDYWKPLLRAYTSWATELDRNSDWEYLHVNEKGILVGQASKKRGKKILPTPRTKMTF